MEYGLIHKISGFKTAPEYHLSLNALDWNRIMSRTCPSVCFCVETIVSDRQPFKVFNPVICSDAVLVIDRFQIIRIWNKRFCYKPMNQFTFTLSDLNIQIISPVSLVPDGLEVPVLAVILANCFIG